MSETNYQRYFGDPVNAAVSLDLENWRDALVRWYYRNDKQGRVANHLLEWLEMEADSYGGAPNFCSDCGARVID